MESFSVNSAKSYLGRNVNLHLKDGAVIVNVQLTRIHKVSGKKSIIEYESLKNRKSSRIPLRHVAWANLLNNNLTPKAA
ncbi:MAG: hypothetical protein ABSF65_05740 [Candidatus Bathyarchaeia archaeon]